MTLKFCSLVEKASFFLCKVEAVKGPPVYRSSEGGRRGGDKGERELRKEREGERDRGEREGGGEEER